MLGFIKRYFFVLLSTYTAKRFGGSLASNSEGRIKCTFLNN